MELLMPVRVPYMSHTSKNSQLNISMHQEQAVQQGLTNQAASAGFVCSVGTAKGQTVLGHVQHVRS